MDRERRQGPEPHMANRPLYLGLINKIRVSAK